MPDDDQLMAFDDCQWLETFSKHLARRYKNPEHLLVAANLPVDPQEMLKRCRDMVTRFCEELEGYVAADLTRAPKEGAFDKLQQVTPQPSLMSSCIHTSYD